MTTPPASETSWIPETKQAVISLLKDPKDPQSEQLRALLLGRLPELARNPEQALEVFPPSKRGGFLDAIARIDPGLSLEWWKLVGEQTWAGSDQSPFLLIDWLSEMKGFKPRSEEEAKTVRDAVEQGMRMAMPLRVGDASTQTPQGDHHQARIDAATVPRHFAIDSINPLEQWENRILAQEGLTRLVVNAEPAWADRGWLFEKLQEHEGAPLFSYTMIGAPSIQCPSLTPQTFIGRCERSTGTFQIRWDTWLNFWLGDYRGRKQAPAYLLPWLASKGMETVPVSDRILTTRVQAAASLSPPDGKMKRWLEVLAILEKEPAGAGRDSNSGIPFSFLALEADRSLLAEAIRRPPPGGLGAKGALGETIWDSLLFPSAKDADPLKPGVGATRQLLKEVPLQCRSTQGFLWRAKREPWAKALAKQTLRSHPDVWIGDTESAVRGALQSLVTLATAPLYEYQANALDVFERLFELEDSDPTLLAPTIKDVMRAAHEILSSHPDVETNGKVRITNRYEAPESQGTDWHERIGPFLETRRLNPPSTLPGTDLLEEHLQSVLLEMQMAQALPDPQERQPNPSKGRAPRL